MHWKSFIYQTAYHNYCVCCVVNLGEADLEPDDVVVDVVHVSHNHTLVLHHVIQHG